MTWEAAAAGSKETFQEQHSWVSGRNQSEEAVLHLAALAGFMFCTACVPFFGPGHLGTGSSSNAKNKEKEVVVKPKMWNKKMISRLSVWHCRGKVLR